MFLQTLVSNAMQAMYKKKQIERFNKLISKRIGCETKLNHAEFERGSYAF